MRKPEALLVFYFIVTLIVTACGQSSTAVATGEKPVSAGLTPNPAGNVNGLIPLTGEINPGRLSHLLGLNVYDKDGKQIGEVSNMVLDFDHSQIKYVLVNSLSEKDVAVPWSALKLQAKPDQNESQQFGFLLQVDQQVFNNAPEVNIAADVPHIGQPVGDWDHDIRTYWNLTELPPVSPSVGPGVTTHTVPSQESQNGIPLKGIILATDALGFGFKLQGQENLDVAIDDMIIDVETGGILYVVIHTNFDNAREQWIPIPLALLEWDPFARVFILNNVDLVTLQEAPFYLDARYPNTTIPGWDDIYVFFWQDHGLGGK